MMDIVKVRYNYRKLIGATQGELDNGLYYRDVLTKHKLGFYEVWRETENQNGDVIYEDDVSQEYGEII